MSGIGRIEYNKISIRSEVLEAIRNRIKGVSKVKGLKLLIVICLTTNVLSTYWKSGSCQTQKLK